MIHSGYTGLTAMSNTVKSKVREAIERHLTTAMQMSRHVGRRVHEGASVVKQFGRPSREQALLDLATDYRGRLLVPNLKFMSFADGDLTALTDNEIQTIAEELGINL